MYLFICLLILTFLIIMFKNRSKDEKIIKLYEKLKSGTPCWPLLGHAYKFIGDGERHMKMFTEHFGREMIQQGGHSAFWMCNMLIVGISDAADAEFILRNYMEKAFLMKFIKDMIGNGNIVAPASIWRHRRKILLRLFSKKYQQSFEDIFVKYSSVMQKQLESRVGTGQFPIGDYFATYTTDLILETTFGEELDYSQKNKLVEIMKMGFKIASERMVSPWQYNATIFKLFPVYYTSEKLKKIYHDYFNKKISTKRREMEENTINENCVAKDSTKSFRSFMELLIEADYGDRKYTNKEVQEEILVIFMAGSDTTATTVGFVTLMLARHPDVQEKVYQELKELFGDSTRPTNSEDLTSLKYLDAVVKETLRLYTPAPIIGRNSDRELTLPSGVTMPANCILMINIWALHRDPKYWGPDAEEFKPERWLDANFSFKHPSQYIPFSSGPRNCAGYKFAMSSMKVMLSMMLRHYRIVPDTDVTTEGLHKPIRHKFSITMTDSDNFVVSLEKRTE